MEHKRNSKLLTVFVVTLLCLSSLAPFLPIAKAITFTVTSSFTATATGGASYIGNEYPVNAWSGSGQTFNATVGGYLWYVSVPLTRTGSPVGYMKCAVYDVDNATSKPDDEDVLIAESTNLIPFDTVDSTGYEWFNFTFDGTDLLTAGGYYCFIVVVEDVTVGFIEGSKEMWLGASSLDYATFDGYAHRFGLTIAWENYALNHLRHYVYVSSTQGLGGSTEGSGWTTSETSELIGNAMEFLVPVVVIMLPAVLFVILFKRTDKWLILIGLAIGVGLGYYFFNIPIWLVFLVAIGLIGLAYSEVRRNG